MSIEKDVSRKRGGWMLIDSLTPLWRRDKQTSSYLFSTVLFKRVADCVGGLLSYLLRFLLFFTFKVF